MTTTLDSKFTIPPITSPESLIFKAARGVNEDWTRAKEEFNTRLVEILSTWSCPDSSAYTTQIASFPAPPHTVQRLAELLEDPTTWYSSLAKFIRALVRVLSVTSTTIDYTEEKKASHVVHEDSLLVPIPWLSQEDIHDDDDHGTSVADLSATTMPNGVRFTVQSRIDGHDLLSDASANGAAQLGGAGTAPMDATDYGPQSEDVKEAIAMNGNAARPSEIPAAVVENGNGRVDEMDTTA